MFRKTRKQISYNMSRIKSRDTGIERTLRSFLRKNTIRFRSNAKFVFGKPDFIVHKKKIAIFCDSAFWHGYKSCKTKIHRFKNNKAFWRGKIKTNIERDKLVTRTLKKNGWIVLRFWDFDIEKKPEKCTDKIKDIIRNEGKNSRN